MAIQFNCVSCQKAIEVSDEWSCRLVECPYCGDTITAPGISQIPVRTETPATNLEGPVSQSPLPSAANTLESGDFQLVRPQRRFDGLALAALLFCLASMVLYGVVIVLMAMKVFEQVGPNATPEQIEAVVDQWSEDTPAWAMKMAVLSVLGFGAWLIGAIMAVIAFVRNRRNPRGKLANWALLLSCYVPLLLLLGLVFQL